MKKILFLISFLISVFGFSQNKNLYKIPADTIEIGANSTGTKFRIYVDKTTGRTYFDNNKNKRIVLNDTLYYGALRMLSIGDTTSVLATLYDLTNDTTHLKSNGDIGYGAYTFTGTTTMNSGLTFTGAQSITTTTGNLTLNPTNGDIITTMTDTTKTIFIGGATTNKAPINIRSNSADGCAISLTDNNTSNTARSTFIGQLAGNSSQIPVTIMGCYNTYNVSNASAINSLSIGGGYSKGQAATGIGFYTSGTGANVPSGTLRWSINSAGVLLGGISAGVPHELRLNGTAYGESGVARNTVANTAGVGYTWYLSGGCTTGSTDKGAGTAAIATGIAAGNGGSIMNLQTVTANQGTGTTDRAPSTKISILNTGGLIYTPKSTGNIDAAVGVTAAMLSFDIRYNGASAIDISANPQIVAGTDGQVIKIIGTSDTNTLTIDDGTGVNCPSTRVIGLNDVWQATYANSVWVETGFTDN